MNSFKRILICLIIQQFMFVPTTTLFNFRPKHFKVERATPCTPVAAKYGGKLEKFDLSQPTKYQFHLDADIRFFKDIIAPIQFHMQYSKCTLDNLGSTCDDSEDMKVNNICDRLTEKSAMWSPLMNIIKPKLVCPIKKGTYIIRNGTFDLALMSRLPIDGFRYATRISLYEMVKNTTEPLQLLCLDSDVSVSLLSSGRPRG